MKFLGFQSGYELIWSSNFEPRKPINSKFSPDVWSRIEKFILWWIRIFPLETKFSFPPIRQFSFRISVLSLTLTSDINLLIEIIIKIHFYKIVLSVTGKTEMKNYKNVFEFSQRRRPFLKNLYSYHMSHMEYIRQKNSLGRWYLHRLWITWYIHR